MEKNQREKLQSADLLHVESVSTNRIAQSRNMLDEICYSVMTEPEGYMPSDTIDIIKEYLDSDARLPRILYSEITQIVYSIDDPSDRENYIGNLRKLCDYSLSPENGIEADIQDMVLRLQDHSDLAFRQIDAMNTDFERRTADTKDALTNKFKGIEKEYVAILGIFAAIIMAFVGGMTFSTSVLQNIASVSIYRLAAVCCLIGIVFFDMIWILVDLVRSISSDRAETESSGRNRVRNWIPAIVFDAVMAAGIIITAVIRYYIR